MQRKIGKERGREGEREGRTERSRTTNRSLAITSPLILRLTRGSLREGGREDECNHLAINFEADARVTKGGGEGGREEGGVPRGGVGDRVPGLGRVVDNGEGDAALNDGRHHQA